MLRKMYYKVWSIVDHVKGKILIPDDNAVISHKNIPYGNDLIYHNFDIHYPRTTKIMQEKLPAIFNIHGGGYVTGRKEGNNHFCQELAKQGFVVFNVDYTPSGKRNKYFPTPVYEFFDFYKFVTEETDLCELVDFKNVFLCGNSAGAHIASLIANIQTNPDLKQGFNLCGGPPVKGVVMICPSLGVYKFKGLFPKKEFHEVVFGPKEDRSPLAEFTHVLEVTTDAFPPSIMLSVNGDFLVGAHKNRFLKMAKELNLSVQHYDVSEGPQLFHCAMVDHAADYPKCMDVIAEFVKDAKQNKFVKGVQRDTIKELVGIKEAKAKEEKEKSRKIKEVKAKEDNTLNRKVQEQLVQEVRFYGESSRDLKDIGLKDSELVR